MKLINNGPIELGATRARATAPVFPNRRPCGPVVMAGDAAASIGKAGKGCVPGRGDYRLAPVEGYRTWRAVEARGATMAA